MQAGKYLNGSPRYGSYAWCKKVVDNDNLTSSDYLRFAVDLRQTGNFKGLIHMQRLLKEKYEKLNNRELIQYT